MSTDTTLLKPGFADPVFDAQAAFRATLDAMAYAGRVRQLAIGLDAPAPLDVATAAIALTLFDFDTGVWLDAKAAAGAAPDYLRFHCGAPITQECAGARFGIVCDAATMPSLDEFDIGEDRYPDRSATLIVQVPTLTGGPATCWSGPGIDGDITVRVGGLPEGFWAQWDLNHALYPLGVDLMFTSGNAVIGLPRGVKVEG